MSYSERLFVLGSSGFIGGVVSLSKEIGREVVTCGRYKQDVFVDLESANYEGILETMVKGDILLFLASISSPDICQKEPERAYRVNVSNTIALIQALVERGVQVIFASSDVVFGEAGKRCEDGDALQPVGPYGEMKAAVERAFIDEPLVKVVRFSYVVGQGDKYTEMLKGAAAAGEAVKVFAGFERNIVSIADVVEGIALLIERWDKITAQRINFSGPELVSREILTAALAQGPIAGLQFNVIEAPEGFWNGRARVIETGCAQFTELLGRKPRGLQQIVDEWR